MFLLFKHKLCDTIMKKKLLSLSLLFLCLENAQAYQISSNHSYIKNSAFTTDHYININGYGDFRFMYNFIDKDTTNGTQTRDADLSSQVEVSVDINLEKQLDELTTVGMHFIPVYNSLYQEINKYYLYVDGFYGRLELGNTAGVYDSMRLGADTIALGSGGINGTFVRTAKLDAGFTYILSPNSFLSQNFGFYNNSIDQDHWNDTKYLTKLNYLSPDFYGFQVGVSIIPNTSLKKDYYGNLSNLASLGNNEVNFGTFLNYGVSYINSFDNLGVAVSFVGEQNISNSLNETSDVKEDIAYEFKSYEIGANINYFGWTIAGSIGRLETNKNKIATTDPLYKTLREKGEYMTYGFAYELGDLAMSITYFESEYKDYTRFNALSIAAEKRMYKGFSIYGEYTNYESESIKGTIKTTHEGNSIFGGIMYNFD